MTEPQRSPNIVLFDQAMAILKESEVIGIERNNPPDSRIRELWPLPADALVVVFERAKAILIDRASRPTRVATDDDRRTTDVLVAMTRLASALLLAANDGLRPRANRPPSIAEIAAYWARYGLCPSCNAQPSRPCYDLREPRTEDSSPTMRPHRGRTIQPGLRRSRYHIQES